VGDDLDLDQKLRHHVLGYADEALADLRVSAIGLRARAENPPIFSSLPITALMSVTKSVTLG